MNQRCRLLLATWVALAAVSCGGEESVAPSSTSAVQTTVPAVPTVPDTRATASTTPQSTTTVTSTSNATTSTSPPASAPPPTTAAAVTGVLLQEITDRYQDRNLAISDFTRYDVSPCYDHFPYDPNTPVKPAGADRLATYGDVFICEVHTEPPADVGELLLIVLDDTGTAAGVQASDGTPYLPFQTPPGLSCEEFVVAHPETAGWLDEPSYVAIGAPVGLYRLALAYWFLGGRSEAMDLDDDGVPCESVFPPDVIAQAWQGEI
jgi:hypothetical protein